MDANDLSRLRWRCRRGMLELDMLLLRFLADEDALSPPDTAVQLTALLAWPDPELWAMFAGAAPPPAPLAALVARIRAVSSR